MNNYRGGITVFLSIVYLSIIVFSCSVVEMTRMNIAKVQAERALVSATQSVLGGYDLWLKDQYGIFARYEGYSDVSFMDSDELQANGLASSGQTSDSAWSAMQLSNHHYSGSELDLAYYTNSHLFNHSEESGGFWHFYQTRLDDIVIKEKILLFNNTGDVSYVKDEMLRFMNLRVPVLLLQPLLEKIDAFEKVSKTGSFLQEKNEIISRAALIEDKYLQLYRLVEGIEINESTGQVASTGEMFVKGLSVGNNEYQSDYMAGMDVEEALEAAVVRLDNVMTSYISCVEQYEDFHNRLVSIQVLIERLENDLVAYKASMAGYEKTLGILDKESKELWADLRSLEELDEPTETDQERLIEVKGKIAAHRDRIANVTLQLDSLTDETAAKTNELEKKQQEHQSICVDLEAAVKEADQNLEIIKTSLFSESGFLSANDKAKETIESIRNEMVSMEGVIDDFVINSEAISGELIENTYTQSIEDVKQLKQSYGLDDGGDGDTIENRNIVDNKESVDIETVGNLNHMLDVIGNNIEVLNRVQNTVSYDDLHAVHTSLNALATNVLEDYPSDLHTAHLMKMDILVAEVESYRRDLYFDYSGFAGFSDEGQQEAAGILEKFQNLKDSMDLSKVFEDAAPVHVAFLSDHPSSVLEGHKVNDIGAGNADGTDSANGIAGANDIVGVNDIDGVNDIGGTNEIDSSNVFSGIDGLGSLGALAGNPKEQLFLNEYAIGMFCAYPDRNDERQLTLSGFAKNSHVLDTEVEYILTGRKDAADALRQTILMILGVRVACNMIHLLTDPAKRTTIMNLANTIAGWWTLGAGALILGILITLLWATAESMVDVMMLTSNRRVPLIKNAGSWYTSLDGNVTDVVGLGADLAEAAVIKIIDVASGKVSRMIDGAGDILTEETDRFYREEMVLLYEEGLLHEEKEALDREIVALTNEINTEIQNYAEAGREGARKIINEKKEAFLSDIRQRQLPAGGLDTPSGGGGSSVQGGLPGSDGAENGISLNDLLPMLSYHDYLRVFMLLDHGASDQRVYRMLDLIELNMYYAHGDRRLRDYLVGIQAEGTFKMDFGLFLENFYRYGRRSGEDVRSFRVSVVNGYE